MCDCDYPEVWEQVTRKAKKPHQCDECRLPISKGDRYIYSKGLYDGGWYDSKTCVECDRLWKYLAQQDDCFCPSFGCLFDEVRNSDARDNKKVAAYAMTEGGLVEIVPKDDSADDYNEDLHERFYARVFRLKGA